jgi:hypothetical protein
MAYASQIKAMSGMRNLSAIPSAAGAKEVSPGA